MMHIPITTNHNRCKLHLSIEGVQAVWVGIKVYDPTQPFSHYFRRKVYLRPQQVREITIALPVSPAAVSLELYNKRSGDASGFKLLGLRHTAMPLSPFWASPVQHRFMDFAIDFAQKAGALPTGFYDSKGHEFLFQYLPKILDQTGKELVTPARIHRLMPRVQISKRQFQTFSIPIRVAILAHEGCHYLLNTRSETEADRCGIRYYLSYGFPKIEAVYAVTKVFGMFPETLGEEHLKRTQEIIRYIETFNPTTK